MASNDNPNKNTPAAEMPRNRRSSITAATLSNLFQRNNPTAAASTAATGTPVFPGALASVAINDQNRLRRLSLSTTAALGLSGASPISPSTATGSGSPTLASASSAAAFGLRRASMSTNSSSSDAVVDENAIDEDESGPRSAPPPTSPYARRTSFGAQAMRNLRGPGGVSSGATVNGRQRSILRGASVASKQQQQQQQKPLTSTSSNSDQGYNWSEQLRSRAESSVAAGSRASFSYGSGTSNSPPRAGGFSSLGGGFVSGGGVGASSRHDRAKSVSDVPRQAPVQPQQPPQPQQRQSPAPRPRRESRQKKPDHFQERILKGDFYMD